MSQISQELAGQMAEFIQSTGESLTELETQLQQGAAKEASCQKLAKTVVEKLAGAKLIAVEEKPNWETSLAADPEYALRTINDLCDICTKLGKQAQAQQSSQARDTAVQRTMELGGPTAAPPAAVKQAGQNGHLEISPAAQVLLDGMNRLR